MMRVTEQQLVEIMKNQKSGRGFMTEEGNEWFLKLVKQMVETQDEAVAG